VTDRRRLSPAARTTRDEIAAVERLLIDAIDAGIDLIQIRERDLEARDLAALTRRIVARAVGTATRVLVNDRADVAIAAGAHGVHLRGDGPASSAIRQLLPPGSTIGRSIHEPGETRDEADCFIFGTVFPSGSKAAGHAVAGVTGLAGAVRATGIRVLAIGGITPANAARCLAAGAAGIAAIGVFLPPGLISGSLGPAGAVAALREEWT